VRFFTAKSIERSIEDHAFSLSYDLGPPPTPPAHSRPLATERETDNLLMGEWGEGWGRSQIMRRRESLVLYKPFNILCFTVILFHGSISHLAPPQIKRKPCMRNGNFVFLLNEKSSRSSSPRRGYMCSYRYMLCIYSIYDVSLV
jgi:hypothetical protein